MMLLPAAPYFGVTGSEWNVFLVPSTRGGVLRGGRGRGGRGGRRGLGGAGPSSIQEPDPVRDHLGDFPLLAVLGFVGADLQAALDRDHAPFGHVLADLLGQFPPGDDVDEVGLAVPLLVPERPVDSQREAGDRRPARHVPEFGISGEATDQDDPVIHAGPPARPPACCWSLPGSVRSPARVARPPARGPPRRLPARVWDGASRRQTVADLRAVPASAWAVRCGRRAA